MEVTSRLNRQAASIALICGFVCTAQSAYAQPPSPAPQPETKPLQTPKLLDGQFEVSTAESAQGLLINVNANNVSVVTLLQEVARKTKVKLVISDNAREVKTKIGLKVQWPARTIIPALSSSSNLVCEKAGEDTYLIVSAPAVSLAPRLADRQMPTPGRTVPRMQPERKVNPKWKPFEFNGSQFYYVPANKGQDPEG